MGKVLGYVVATAVLVAGLFAPAWVLWVVDAAEAASDASEVTEPTSIVNYEATFDLGADGDLLVEERLTVSFPSYTPRHGIFRFWDRVDASDERVRRRVDDVAVSLDGDDVPFEMQTAEHGRFDVAKIGDADAYVRPGEHLYVITYRVPDALEDGFGDAASSFHWDLVPSGWQQDIDRAVLTVRLPAPARDVQCGIGLEELPPPCEQVTGQDTTTLTIRTGPLADHTPVTLRAGVDVPTPEVAHLPWTPRYDVVLGQSLPRLWLVLGLAAAAAALGVLVGRRAHETPPPFALAQEPPIGVGPAQAAYLMTERSDRSAYVASLLHAADRGAVTLTRSGETWTITDTGGAGWSGLDPVTTSTAHLLGGPGTPFTADPRSVAAGERLKTEVAAFDTYLREWARATGHLEVVPGAGIAGFVTLACWVAAGAAAIWNPFDMSITGLVPGLYAVLARPTLRLGATTRRTATGREVWAQAGGFKRLLESPSMAESFEFSGRENLYAAYVPWAVAFGCADQWAEKYRTEMGHEPPTPRFLGDSYTGHGLVGATTISSMVGDFDGALGSAISAYDATQASSSDSGSSSSSGGGGGGGGGGGSW